MIVEEKKEKLHLSLPFRSTGGERLLQFIWQFQYFNQGGLKTTSGEELQIIYPGTYNTNQGPDFTGAKIKIGNTMWAGNVELHVRASDWNRHNHQLDKNYNNVILHVVWETIFQTIIFRC